MKTLIKGLAAIVLIMTIGCTGGEKSAAASGSTAIKDLSKKEVIEKITPEVIAGLADKDLEQAIFDNISGMVDKDSSDLGEKVKALSAGQRAIYSTWVVEAEVNHGGFQQFYDNAGKSLAEISVEGFITIGAPQFAELMRQTNLIYKDISSGNRKVPGGADPYDALEDLYLKTYKAEPLDQLKVKYIRANPTEFGKSESVTGNQ